MGLLLAGTDNRWKAGPALQGERGDGWVSLRGDRWMGGGRERQKVLVHENDRRLWPLWSLISLPVLSIRLFFLNSKIEELISGNKSIILEHSSKFT